MSLAKRDRLWKKFDIYMEEWDAIEEEAGQLFEDTHPWLFNPGIKPEIIENEETIEREDHINQKRRNILQRIESTMAELFPPKEPTPPEQGRLLPGAPEVKWSDNG